MQLDTFVRHTAVYEDSDAGIVLRDVNVGTAVSKFFSAMMIEGGCITGIFHHPHIIEGSISDVSEVITFGTCASF